MIGAFDTTSSLTQTDFYVVYIFSVCQLIGIFFLIRLSFVYRSSPIIQVQNLPARPQTTIKNRKDEQGGRSTFGRLNLKTEEKENRVDRTSGNRKKCSDAHARQWSVRYCFRVWCLRTECCDQIQSCQENILKLQRPS